MHQHIKEGNTTLARMCWLLLIPISSSHVFDGWEGSAHGASIFADSLSRIDWLNIRDVSSTKDMLDMHADLGFYQPSGKPSIE
jgi:hypothetical protein